MGQWSLLIKPRLFLERKVDHPSALTMCYHFHLNLITARDLHTKIEMLRLETDV